MSTSEHSEDPFAGTASWLFLGAHGDAGTSTLVRYSRQRGRRYAARFDAAPTSDLPVVMVCRDTIAGLWKAQQRLARQDVAARLAGLVVVGESPGPTPAPVASSVRLLSGAVPRLWQVPYLPVLRLVHPAALTDAPWPAIHPDLAHVLDNIRAAVAAQHTPTHPAESRY